MEKISIKLKQMVFVAASFVTINAIGQVDSIDRLFDSLQALTQTEIYISASDIEKETISHLENHIVKINELSNQVEDELEIILASENSSTEMAEWALKTLLNMGSENAFRIYYDNIAISKFPRKGSLFDLSLINKYKNLPCTNCLAYKAYVNLDELSKRKVKAYLYNSNYLNEAKSEQQLVMISILFTDNREDLDYLTTFSSNSEGELKKNVDEIIRNATLN